MSIYTEDYKVFVKQSRGVFEKILGQNSLEIGVSSRLAKQFDRDICLLAAADKYLRRIAWHRKETDSKLTLMFLLTEGEEHKTRQLKLLA